MRIRISILTSAGVCIILIAFMMKFGPGMHAQRTSTEAIAQAVTDSQQTDALSRAREELTSMGLRLAAQDQELRSIENELARMQGVGLGLGGALTLLNIVQFVVSLRRRKE